MAGFTQVILSFRVQGRPNSDRFSRRSNCARFSNMLWSRDTRFSLLQRCRGLGQAKFSDSRIDDLDFEQRLIFVRLSAWYRHLILPKSTRSVATVPMPGPLAEVLTNYLGS